jgi:hypothetical protein
MFYRIFINLNSLVVLISLSAPLSCNSFGNRQQEPVARVYNSWLYREDLVGMFPQGTTPDDSARIARGYIDRWIRNQLLLRHAEANLPQDKKNVEKQIASFRTSLLIHTYQQHMIAQKLDTIIPLYEIEDYYHSNINNFNLDRAAVSGVFIKIPLSAPNRDRIPLWFNNGNDLVHIENYADQYAQEYIMFYDDWVYLDDVINRLPAGSVTSGNFSDGDTIMISDEDHQYFLGISGYLAPPGTIPMALVGEKIKSIILNKRKIKFLNDLEHSVLTEGSGRNAFEYFSN